MVRDWRLLVFPLIVFIVFTSVLLLYFSRRGVEQKPQQPDKLIKDEKPKDDEDLKWYVQFSVKNQKSTAYTEEVGAPVAANGENYIIGACAVHPQYPINQGGKPRKPIINFGTHIHLSEPVSIQGNLYDTLLVNDTGDVYYGLWSDSHYWIDLYFGQSSYWNNVAAGKYGIKPVNYYWFEEWK